jgi:DNA-binding PadR family transcriptional regulator
MAVARVDVVVLGLLAEEPLYGYELLERFRSRGMGRWTEVGRASVYQALQRLERDGLVSGREEGGTEGPDRRVYRITRPGRDRLGAGLRERFGEDAGYRSDPFVAMGLAYALPTADGRAGVAGREAALLALLDGLDADRARLKRMKGPANTVARRMLDLQASLARAELDWLASFRRDLSRMRSR